MKSRVFVGALAWLVLITGLHVQLNVGWDRLYLKLVGRRELLVGFLPVT